MSKLELTWGLANSVPEGVAAAWGARTILHNGTVDIVFDRTSFEGTKEGKKKLSMALGDADARMRDKVRELCESWDMSSSKQGEHILYEDDDIKIVGDTRASCGYLYMAAWLK